MQNKILPTKKQRELLIFIDEFIRERGYSPSYREIMRSLNYNSVATVSLHVNSLISRGHLIKRGRSARSLEVLDSAKEPAKSNPIKPTEEKWLVEKIENIFQELEAVEEIAHKSIDELYVLVGALKVLGIDHAATSFIPRLSALKESASQSVK
jgi:repressor LexA